MSINSYKTNRLVKGDDLNHHGTLYAGRTAEWFVESGFVAAANLTNPANIVCQQIHSMQFSRPVQKGQVVCLESQIVYAGRTSLIAHIYMTANDKEVLQGFITFVHVDFEGKSLAHGITLSPETDRELELSKEAEKLRKRN